MMRAAVVVVAIRFVAALVLPTTHRHGAENIHDKAHFHFLHIGKCGGTSIEHALMPYHDESNRLQQSTKFINFFGHLSTVKYVRERFQDGLFDDSDTSKVIFFVRAPVHRFTSGWLSRFRKGAPVYHVPWRPFEEEAFLQFESPDALGCALSSTNLTRRQAAEKAMKGIEHVNMTLAHMLGGMETVDRMRDSIAFVGRIEHFQEDIDELIETLKAADMPVPSEFPEDYDAQDNANPDPASLEHFKNLGRCAVNNLRRWYAEDYRIIERLSAFGLLDADYVKEIDELDTAPPEGEYKRFLQQRVVLTFRPRGTM